MSVDKETGIVVWKPTAIQIDAYYAEIAVSDGKGGKAIQSLNLVAVTPTPNRAPVIESTPRTNANPLLPYAYQIKAIDADGDNLTYQLVNPPTGMTVDGKGAIAWQPTTAQLGTCQIAIRVSDGNAITTQTYQLAVTNNVINNAPTITSAPNLITNLERTYRYNLSATDKDGDELFWSLESALL